MKYSNINKIIDCNYLIQNSLFGIRKWTKAWGIVANFIVNQFVIPNEKNYVEKYDF